jgi:carbamoyltransferase
MYILGINSVYHESSVCLLKDGRIIAAAEEERFTRKKHAKQPTVHNPHELPLQALRYCLTQANIRPQDIDRIGYSFNPRRPLFGSSNEREIQIMWGNTDNLHIFTQNMLLVPQILQNMGFTGAFTWIDHHICHAASAFYLSPFDNAAVLAIDGIGENGTTLLARGDLGNLNVLQEIYYPASLGFFWEKLSMFLGFSRYDACKVMGLAAYGDSERYASQFATLIQKQTDDIFSVNSDILFSLPEEDYTELEALFHVPKRECEQPIKTMHQDIAAGLQKVTNDIVLHIATHLYHHTRLRNLCLAGGVALNCTTNSFLHENGPFHHLFIQPAAHDAGTAVGVALALWYKQTPQSERRIMTHAYWGPSFTNDSIEQILKQQKIPYTYISAIEQKVAQLLQEGNIVGWFQGAMELGPRALGNRSLLADPRNPHMRDVLNQKIKHREDFRPFAPSVLFEAAHEWFEILKPTLAADFMLMAYPVKTQVRDKIPAVLHVDGTSRIQIVRQEINPRYHRLITEFYHLTGVPLILNTSFNDNEPIVCTPHDALHTFLKTQMDYLALGDFLLDRRALQ